MNLQPPEGEIVVKHTAVYALNRDRNPEVFAILRQRSDSNAANR